jgi:hypothetical protein
MFNRTDMATSRNKINAVLYTGYDTGAREQHSPAATLEYRENHAESTQVGECIRSLLGRLFKQTIQQGRS